MPLPRSSARREARRTGRTRGRAARAGPGGVLLVEFLDEGRFGDSKAEAWPFVAGYLAGRGVQVRWICFSREEQRSAEDALIVELRPEARERLIEEADSVAATHVLLSELPNEGLRRSLAARFPGRVRHVAGGEPQEAAFERRWLVRWLELADDEDGYLPDLAAPDYASRAADSVATRSRPLTHLVGGPACLFAAPLRRNPFYRDVGLSGVVRDFGCAFCSGPSTLKYPFLTPPVDLALRQIRSVQEARDTLRDPREFMVDSARLFFELDDLFRRLVDEGIPASGFFFRCRPDELLAQAEAFDRVLPLAQRAGHRIHIVSMGVENFSEVENERLNRRLSVAQVRAALDRLRAWEDRWPETFFFDRQGGLGFILFTPWTTLEDLRRNLDAARELRLGHADFFLTRRAMLRDESPLTQLAARDGLLEVGEDEMRIFDWLRRYCDPGCRRVAHERDIPWRFRDPLVAAVCAIAVRLAKPAPVVEDDPYHGRIQRALRVSAASDDLLGSFGLLLDTAASHSGRPTVADLLDAFIARLAASSSTEPLPAMPAAGARRPAWAAMYLRLFARAAREPSDPLRGFTLGDVAVQSGRLRLAFGRAKEAFVVWAAPGEPRASGSPRAGGLRLSCDESTPAVGEDRRQILAVIARVLAAARRRDA